MPIFLTIVIALGAYFDWSLDYKNEYFKKKKNYLITIVCAPLRFVISIIFFVVYILEENYRY